MLQPFCAAGLQLQDDLLVQAAKANIPHVWMLVGVLAENSCFHYVGKSDSTGLSGIYAACVRDDKVRGQRYRLSTNPFAEWLHLMNQLSTAAEPNCPRCDVPDSQPLMKQLLASVASGTWHCLVDAVHKAVQTAGTTGQQRLVCVRVCRRTGSLTHTRGLQLNMETLPDLLWIATVYGSEYALETLISTAADVLKDELPIPAAPMGARAAAQAKAQAAQGGNAASQAAINQQHPLLAVLTEIWESCIKYHRPYRMQELKAMPSNGCLSKLGCQHCLCRE